MNLRLLFISILFLGAPLSFADNEYFKAGVFHPVEEKDQLRRESNAKLLKYMGEKPLKDEVKAHGGKRGVRITHVQYLNGYSLSKYVDKGSPKNYLVGKVYKDKWLKTPKPEKLKTTFQEVSSKNQSQLFDAVSTCISEQKRRRSMSDSLLKPTPVGLVEIYENDKLEFIEFSVFATDCMSNITEALDVLEQGE